MLVGQTNVDSELVTPGLQIGNLNISQDRVTVLGAGLDLIADFKYSKWDFVWVLL
jgi:hypothetical protein